MVGSGTATHVPLLCCFQLDLSDKLFLSGDDGDAAFGRPAAAAASTVSAAAAAVYFQAAR